MSPAEIFANKQIKEIKEIEYLKSIIFALLEIDSKGSIDLVVHFNRKLLQLQKNKCENFWPEYSQPLYVH